jgi:predicted secreted protein
MTRLRLLLSTLVLAFAPALPAGAQSAASPLPPPPPRPAVIEPQPTFIHLTDQAERAIERDRLHAVLRAEATGSDARQVQAQINQRMTAALDRIHKVAGIAAETTGYNVYQEHRDKLAPLWHGSQGVSLTGTDATALLSLVGDLQQQGLVMSNLAYELQPETARRAEDALTTEALGRLKRRAENVAETLGLKVDRFRVIHISNAGEESPRPMMRAMAAAPAAPPPVAEPGTAQVSVTVEADIVLMPK